MAALLDRARIERSHVSHLTINGANAHENDQLFHTLRQHFRKLQKRGRDIAWVKCYSFDDNSNCHLHIAVFHDLPLSALLADRKRTATRGPFDLPRFKCQSDRLRPVFHNGRWVFRSYNYKIHLTPHDNPESLVAYFLDPRNFQPINLLEHRRQWLTSSRNISTAGGIHEALKELLGIWQEFQDVAHALGMDAPEVAAFRRLIHGRTKPLTEFAEIGSAVRSATRDSDCNIVKDNTVIIGGNTLNKTDRNTLDDTGRIILAGNIENVNATDLTPLAGTVDDRTDTVVGNSDDTKSEVYSGSDGKGGSYKVITISTTTGPVSSLSESVTIDGATGSGDISAKLATVTTVTTVTTGRNTLDDTARDSDDTEDRVHLGSCAQQRRVLSPFLQPRGG
jgi:hypothetical protein